MKENLLRVYESDASQMKGSPVDVFLPTSIEEVQKIIRENQRIVPRGAGTGLAGGAVPLSSDSVLDLSRLDSIGEYDNEQKTIIVEAGVILDDLQVYLSKYGLEFPVKPSSHAVATIGGMIATNAVGNRAIKYGKTSNWIKWIEVVNGSGEISRKGITELSDYSGLEGITGVIVKACLKLSPLKKRTGTLLAFTGLEDLTTKVRDLKRHSEISMIEFVDKTLSEKIGLGIGYHLIVEYENDEGELNDEEFKEVLNKRDSLYPIVAEEGYYRIEDPKIMIEKFVPLMIFLENKKVPTFGHIGVGILHPCFNHDQEKYIPEMMKAIKRLGGQVSGEHGIGILKKAFVEFNDKKIWENVKKRTDPENKFNVGKVI